MKIISLILILLLSGCVNRIAIPAPQREFPTVNEELILPCPDLFLVDQNTDKLSDVTKVTSKNYGLYHDCKNKVDNWIEWYKNQKNNFNQVKPQ